MSIRERGSPPGTTAFNQYKLFVTVAWWLIAVVLLGPPLALRAHRMLRERRRRRQGRCARCGYDLRGTSDVCPECGAKAASPAEVVSQAV